MKIKLFLPLLAFVVLTAVLGIGLSLNPRMVPSPFIGKPAPAFTLPQLKKEQAAFAPEQMKGQVWLLNVWASWCAPCREEHALLLAASAREKTLPIVGLNYKDDPRNADEWLRKLGDPYTGVAVDRDGRVAIDYGVYGVPETFVIDKQGIVRLKHVGPLSDEVWTRDVMPLVRKLQS